MSDVDYGLILGSTNEEIWTEEVAKSAGSRAVAKAFFCGGRTCPLSARQHVQHLFDDIDILRQCCEFLAPFEHETPERLRDRVAEDFHPIQDDDDEDEADLTITGGMLRVEPQSDGTVRLFLPDGQEVVFDDVPAPLQRVIGAVLKDLQSLFEDDDETPPKPPLH